MKWKRIDLARGVGSPLHAYEAYGKTGRWRITKDNDGWTIRLMKPNEMQYRVYMRCITHLWEAKFRAEKRDESESYMLTTV